MKTKQNKILGYCILLTGFITAPLFPFIGLMIIPLLAVWCGVPFAALLFAILLDSFLVPDGITPLWTSLTFYTVLILSLYTYLRYTTSL